MSECRWPTYWEFVEHEAALVKTDGCSKVTGAYRRCCLTHDLSYFHARDPVSAYLRYVGGDPHYWHRAERVTRAEADADFRRCMQAQSKAGFFSPLAAIRWLALKVGGRKAWNTHRTREAREST